MLLFGFVAIFTLGSQIIAESYFLVNSGNKKTSLGRKGRTREARHDYTSFKTKRKPLTRRKVNG